MELALAPASEPTRSDSAPSTVASVQSMLPAPTSDRRQSPSLVPDNKQRKARKRCSPTSCKGKKRAGREQRPVWGSSSPPDGGQALTPAEQPSPLQVPSATLGTGKGTQHLAVPSTQQAFQTAKDILSLPVRPRPAADVPRSRGMPALGPLQ